MSSRYYSKSNNWQLNILPINGIILSITPFLIAHEALLNPNNALVLRIPGNGNEDILLAVDPVNLNARNSGD